MKNFDNDLKILNSFRMSGSFGMDYKKCEYVVEGDLSQAWERYSKRLHWIETGVGDFATVGDQKFTESDKRIIQDIMPGIFEWVEV